MNLPSGSVDEIAPSRLRATARTLYRPLEGMIFRERAFSKRNLNRFYPYIEWPGPIAYAHRGGGATHPENTVAAFDNAVALGFTYIELDVHLSKDGVLVVCHDGKLDRTTNMRGEIRNLTYDEIRTADAGYRFSMDGGKTFPFRGKGIGVPRLEDVLKRYPHSRFSIDPKCDEAVGPLMDLLAKLNAYDRVGLTCVPIRRIETARKRAPGKICTGMSMPEVVRAFAESQVGAIAPRGAQYVQVPLYRKGIGVVNAKFIRAAHVSGLRVHVWTINDEATMNYLLDIGCDGIFTDRPELLKKVLIERGMWIEPKETGKRGHLLDSLRTLFGKGSISPVQQARGELN